MLPTINFHFTQEIIQKVYLKKNKKNEERKKKKTYLPVFVVAFVIIGCGHKNQLKSKKV